MEIQELRERILEVLNIEKDTSFSDDELCQMLKKKRAKFHPDKTQDSDLKEDFDKKFIEVDDLYKKFTNVKVKENQLSEIVLISKDLDYFETKEENIKLEETVESLKKENIKKEKTISDLKNCIEIISKESILKERESLINSIKPQKKDYFKPLGIIASLTLGLNLLTKFENISNILRESFRINANYILLSLFSIICVIYIYNLIREHLIKNVSLSICTTKFVRDFGKNRYSNFSESDVFNYISDKVKSKKGLVNWIYKRFFCIYNDSTLETLKEIFILEQLNKKVIRFGEIYDLEQKYLIVRQRIEKTENGEVYLKEF
jgi:hypothetical protein